VPQIEVFGAYLCDIIYTLVESSSSVVAVGVRSSLSRWLFCLQAAGLTTTSPVLDRPLSIRTQTRKGYNHIIVVVGRRIFL